MPPNRSGRTERRNTFKLPAGEAIRRELRRIFATQRRQVVASIRDARAKAARPRGVELKLDAQDYEFPPLKLGALEASERMAPLIEAIWDDAGFKFTAELGLDPDAWEVTNPHTRRKIEEAAFAFCDATNQTTTRALGDALQKLRAELAEGIVDRGDSLDELAKRVNRIFDGAEKWRARRIAASEASRAKHAAEEEAAKQSGVVAGFEWLLSADACPLCQTVARRCRRVQLGNAFAKIGDHPVYSEVRHPPLHPSCQCSMLEVLKPEYGGPENPAWAETLDQPTGRPPAKPKPATTRKPKPAKPPSDPNPVVGPAGTPVSRALDIPAGAMEPALRAVVAAIDRVHGDGNLPRIPVEITNSATHFGEFRRYNQRPSDIRISKRGRRVKLTFAHEIGHFLECSGIPGGNPRNNWSKDPLFSVWTDAIKSSAAYDQIQALASSRKYGAKHARYLLTKEEMWARSYAQYIAIRSGDSGLLDDLRAQQADSAVIASQWTDDDFAPIAAAIDGIFIKLGWRK